MGCCGNVVHVGGGPRTGTVSKAPKTSTVTDLELGPAAVGTPISELASLAEIIVMCNDGATVVVIMEKNKPTYAEAQS